MKYRLLSLIISLIALWSCTGNSLFAVRDEAAVFIEGDEVLRFSKEGESEGTGTTVTVTCNYDWVAYPSVEWISVDPSEGKAGVPVEVNISITDENDGEIREGRVNFFDIGMLTKSFVTVIQNGSYFIVDDVALSAGFMEKSVSFAVRANTSWSVESLTEGFSCDVNGGDGDGTVTVSFSENSGEDVREAYVLVTTEAELTVKRYMVTITQDFGLILRMMDWSLSNVIGSSSATEDAKIKYVGDDANYSIPTAKGQRKVVDPLQYGDYKPVHVWGGWPDDSSNPGSYYYTSAGMRLNYGSSSSTNPCAWIRLPEYEGYRPVKIDLTVQDTRSYKIAVPADAVADDPSSAVWGKFTVIGPEKKSSSKGSTLSWDISDKSVGGAEYYIVAKNTQSVVQHIVAYYEKLAQ